MRTDDKDWSGKCICTRAIHFPIPHPSHLLNLLPLQTSCILLCVQHWCHFHPLLCSYLWCHWKMTKLEPRQNFLFCTPHEENCPLFSLLALFHTDVVETPYSFSGIHATHCQYFPTHINNCAIYFENIKEQRIMTSKRCILNSVSKSASLYLTGI